MKTKYLVVDTAAFVKNVPLWEYGEELYSLPEVMEEIRDRHTRDRIAAFPVPVSMRQPQPHSIRFVNEFSKKTGDYASLSLADMKVLALAYELEVEARGNSQHLRSEPKKVVTEFPGMKSIPENQQDNTQPTEQTAGEEGRKTQQGTTLGKDPHIAGEQGMEGESEGESDTSECEGDLAREQNEENEDENDNEKRSEVENERQIESENSEDDDNEDAEEEKEEEDDDDDDDGWITPSNLKKHKIKSGLIGEDEVEDEEDVLVACITSDFAVQNVLKHIGLSVMGVDGKLIRRLKTYILRCYTCYKTTSLMTKVFCPHCGNKTLKKVCVTVDPDGSQRIWINTRRPISTRGTKYSLPTPKGGKHGRNPMLVADQREAKHFSSKMSKKKVNPLHQDYNPDGIPFAVRDVFSRAAQLGYIGGKNHNHFYWEKRNPNEPQKRTGKKKKK